MSSPDSPKTKGSGWLGKIFRFLRMLLAGFLSFLLIAWASLALYYGNLPWPGLGTALALIFFGFGVWALWRPYRLRRIGMFVVAYAALLLWWKHHSAFA